MTSLHLSCMALAASLMSACAAAGPSEKLIVLPSDSFVTYEGRVVLTDSTASFVYPGTSIGLAFEGTAVSARLKPEAGYYSVEVDGRTVRKLNPHGTSDSLFVLADSLPEGPHSVRLTLVSEGLFVHPEFGGFELSGRPCAATDSHDLKIEFIGNSITCGYGVEAASALEHFADSTSNFGMTYAALTAKALNAAKMVVARSGIGAYRNYADNPDGSEWPMPRVYRKALISGSDAMWDFGRFRPDVVCINLGTNDLSVAGYKIDLYARAYADFVRMVRSNYPQAQIVMLTGTMLQSPQLDEQKAVLDSLCATLRSEGDSAVFRFDMEPQDMSLPMGADYHPSADTHRRMAAELTEFIRSIRR